MRRAVALATVFASMAGCVSTSDVGLPNLPEGALVYQFDPTTIRYEFVDTTAGHNFSLRWLPAEKYTGLNCFGLTPRIPGDTIGAFVFATAGPNYGFAERNTDNIIDTTAVDLFPSTVPVGTRGAYALQSGGTLNLLWADGIQARYFDQDAIITLIGDTIRAQADLRSNGDSIRAVWDVRWTLRPSCS